MSSQRETGDRDRQTTATATERVSYQEEGDVLAAIDARRVGASIKIGTGRFVARHSGSLERNCGVIPNE